MSIDFKNERLIRVRADVPRLDWLTTKPSGSTAARWVRVGVRGVKLDAVRAGGTLCTTERALLEFFERLKDPDPTPGSVTPSQAHATHTQADAALAAAGL